MAVAKVLLHLNLLVLLLHLLLLLQVFEVEGREGYEGSRPRRQFSGDLNPSFSSGGKESPSLLGALTLQECSDRPQIPHSRVRCGYSGCRVICDRGFKTASGVGFTTLSCDHSTGNLTVNGAPWEEMDVSCQPYCGVEGCKNGGTCSEPGTCECPTGFSGEHCEVAPENHTQEPAPAPQADPNSCPEPDFPVQNARVKVEGQYMVVSCDPGHVFRIGRSTAYIMCRNGKWDHPEGVFEADGALVCGEKRCNPPCLNGGTCLPEGVCDCPYRYWGGHCQHRLCSYPDAASLLQAASLGGTLSRMKIQCHPGHKMLNGRRTQTILCRRGEWFLPRRGYLKDKDAKCYPEGQMPSAPSP